MGSLNERVHHTNWVVITGAPSCGKTSVLVELAQEKHRVVPEAARAYIEEQQRRGRLLEEICANQRSLQQFILPRSLESHEALPHEELHFFDRGLPDGLAYCRLYGLDPSDYIRASQRYRYRAVFHLEPLPFKKDTVRIEDPVTAALLHEYLLEGYAQLGYDVLRVPVLPTARERMLWVLEQLKDVP